MRTLIISDLHLGSLSGSGVLQRAPIREALLEALQGVDRLVLLGDVLELRHGPAREAMLAAKPFFEELGAALAGRELLITAGNHDHAIVEPWLAQRGELHAPPPLAPEQLFEAQHASPALARIAEWAAPARVGVAYPGLWVRPDVYATHGHYLDCHLTIPTLERLSMGVMMRLLGRTPDSLRGAADHEAICAPMFAWRDAVARERRTNSTLNGLSTVTAWRALGGGIGGGDLSSAARRVRTPRAAVRSLRIAALRAGFPLAVAALNRAGLGPMRTDVSSDELRRAGLRAMAQVADHMGLGPVHVVFGHTHRTGPLPGDEQAEWQSAGGALLYNTGSWTYSGVFLTDTPGESPYWPGSAVLVEEHGPPRVLRLLQHLTRAQIRPGRASRTRAPA